MLWQQGTLPPQICLCSRYEQAAGRRGTWRAMLHAVPIQQGINEVRYSVADMFRHRECEEMYPIEVELSFLVCHVLLHDKSKTTVLGKLLLY